jgi:hypothetical protein
MPGRNSYNLKRFLERHIKRPIFGLKSGRCSSLMTRRRQAARPALLRTSAARWKGK